MQIRQRISLSYIWELLYKEGIQVMIPYSGISQLEPGEKASSLSVWYGGTNIEFTGWLNAKQIRFFHLLMIIYCVLSGRGWPYWCPWSWGPTGITRRGWYPRISWTRRSIGSFVMMILTLFFLFFNSLMSHCFLFTLQFCLCRATPELMVFLELRDLL